MIATDFFGNPASYFGACPVSAVGGRALQGLSQFFLLLRIQQGFRRRGLAVPAAVSHRVRPFSVVALDNFFGVVVVETYNLGCLFDSPISGN
jgi:hypothetical protein